MTIVFILHHAQSLLGRDFLFLERMRVYKKGGSVMNWLQKYPSFLYKQSITTDGRILLLDEPLEQQVRKELQSLETADGQELLFLEDKDLAVVLEEILTEILGQNSGCLLVFPGNGSNYPRKMSRICKESWSASVFAKRFWQPGTDPTVMTGVIFPEFFLIMNVETVVVIDDVISSGLTMQKIAEKNQWRFTQAKWIGVSWVAQIPQVRSSSGVKGYRQIATACVIGKTNGSRAPINSLSTLRGNKEIATSYASRHFRKPDDFLQLIGR